MGYGDLQCYNPDSRIPTPQMNKLAHDGLLFTNAHSPSSVCTPSRYGILTGQYPFRSRLKAGVLWSYDWPLISSDRFTLGKLFKASGYETAIIGKWHLGWNWPLKPGADIDTSRFGILGNDHTTIKERAVDFNKTLRGGPLDCGFDYQFGVDIPSLPPFCFIENGKILGQKDEALSKTMKGFTTKGWSHEKMLPAILSKSVDFIKARKDASAPFFLYITLTAPHTPIYPNRKYNGMSMAGDYGDLVVEIDSFLGDILDQVRINNMEDNTIIVFTSDNGGINAAGDLSLRGPLWSQFGSLITLFNHDSNNGFAGMKGDLYEGGHRVPLIIKWPGIVAADKKSKSLIGLTDLFKTFAEILDFKLSDTVATDSYSFLKILKGDLNAETRDALAIHSSKGKLGVIKDSWKYIDCNDSGGNLKYTFQGNNHFLVNTPGQLYNLRTDPREAVNLYDIQIEMRKKLSNLLEQITSR